MYELSKLVQIVIFTVFGVLFLFPGLVILTIVGTIARFFVALFARAVRPDLVEIYNDFRGLDYALEDVYTRPLINTVTHWVCDGTVSVEELRKAFRERVLSDGKNYCHLTQRWTTFMGYLFWQADPNFDLKNHIRVYDYKGPQLHLTPASTTSTVTEKDLERITGPLMTHPFGQGQSPWELLIVPKYKSSWNQDGHDQFVMTLRFHHGLGDAYSIFKLFLRLFDQEHVTSSKAKFARQMPTWWEKLQRLIIIAVRIPFDFAVKLLDLVDGPNCWHLVGKGGGDKFANQYQTLFSEVVQVDQLKSITKVHGVSFNAAAYAVTAGAIATVMKEMGQELPDKMASLHPHPLPDHPGGLVNHFRWSMFTFHPKQATSAKMLLQQISKTVKSADYLDLTPIWFDCVLQTVAKLPTFLANRARNLFQFSLIMSSVPGPPVHVNIFDTGRMVEVMGAVGPYIPDLGATSIMMSLAGKKRIVLVLDRAILKQQHEQEHRISAVFARSVQDQIEDLLRT